MQNWQLTCGYMIQLVKEFGKTLFPPLTKDTQLLVIGLQIFSREFLCYATIKLLTWGKWAHLTHELHTRGEAGGGGVGGQRDEEPYDNNCLFTRFIIILTNLGLAETSRGRNPDSPCPAPFTPTLYRKCKYYYFMFYKPNLGALSEVKLLKSG